MTKSLQPFQIAPSLLACDLAQLGQEIQLMDQAGVDLFHLDVMDGHFVPNLTFGPAILSSIRSWTKKPIDVHLMINPVDYMIPAFAKAGADMISVHVESNPNLHRSISLIKSLNVKVGIVLNPATPAEMILPVIEDIDFVLIMSVNPGFGGQSFIRSQLQKIERVRSLLNLHNPKANLEVDGGIGLENFQDIISAGADMLVIGTGLFGLEAQASDRAHDYQKRIQLYRNRSVT